IWKNTPLTAAAGNGYTGIFRWLIENGADLNKEGWNTPLTAAVENGHTHIVRLLIENGANFNKRRWSTVLTAAAKNGYTDIVRLLIENGADVNEGGWICKNSPLTAAAENGHTDIVRWLIENGADVSKGGLFVIAIEPLVDRRKFEADARDTKLSLERHVDVQLRGKKVASLPKRPGKKLKTQTEMTSPRDIIEESKCGKDSMTDVELGLNCLHLSPRCEQFKPCIMEELPGDSSIMRHDFKPISKRMDRVTLRDVDNAKQGHWVVVEVAKTHPRGSIIYGIKINEEGSGVLGEPFQLATKDLKDTWEDEEVKAENVQIGSVFKYVQVGDEFVFQGNTKRPRQNVDKILLDLSCAGGSCRDIRDAYSYAEISSERIHQDCASKETLCFISIKCSEIQNETISFVAKLGELLNLKLNCREHFMLHRSPGALQLIDGEEPHLITGDDGSSKPWDYLRGSRSE
ncbi:Ankyrin repeat domain-containing protein 17, partial [Stylophora pistillata]